MTPAPLSGSVIVRSRVTRALKTAAPVRSVSVPLGFRSWLVENGGLWMRGGDEARGDSSAGASDASEAMREGSAQGRGRR